MLVVAPSSIVQFTLAACQTQRPQSVNFEFWPLKFVRSPDPPRKWSMPRWNSTSAWRSNCTGWIWWSPASWAASSRMNTWPRCPKLFQHIEQTIFNSLFIMIHYAYRPNSYLDRAWLCRSKLLNCVETLEIEIVRLINTTGLMFFWINWCYKMLQWLFARPAGEISDIPRHAGERAWPQVPVGHLIEDLWVLTCHSMYNCGQARHQNRINLL